MKINYSSNFRIVRTISHEKNFEVYRNVKNGSYLHRIFIILRFLYQLLKYTYWDKIRVKPSDLIFHVMGANQERLHNFVMASPNTEFLSLFKQNALIDRNNYFIKKYFKPKQTLFLSILLIFALFNRKPGKRILIFYLEVHKIINRLVKNKYSGCKYFVSYNDQNMITASLALSFMEIGCRTIVFQHGLIFRSLAYFPCNSDEFWAWGDVVKEHFTAMQKSSVVKVTGRFASDNVANDLDINSLPKKRKLLIALGWRWSEILKEMKALNKLMQINSEHFDKVYIKLHPSVKFKKIFRLYLLIYYKHVLEERRHIEGLVLEYSSLYTKNSTLLLDFLLAGKNVFLSAESNLPKEIIDHCLPLNSISNKSSTCSDRIKNERSTFLRKYFNVNIQF